MAMSSVKAVCLFAPLLQLLGLLAWLVGLAMQHPWQPQRLWLFPAVM